MAEQGSKRSLSWPQFLGLVVVYLAILQGLGVLLGPADANSDHPFPDADAMLRSAAIPIFISMLFTVSVVTWLGWWDEAIHEHKPVQRWVWFVPASMITAALIGIDYAHLLDEKVALVLTFVVMVAMVGFTEELMFRGIGLNVFRKGGFTEGKVALWTSIIFGAAHLSNAIGHGPEALIQAVVVSTSGYFLYLVRRTAGTIVLAMFVHGLWDFSLISSGIGLDPDNYAGAAAPIALQVILIVVLLRRRKRIEPTPASSEPAPAT